MRHFADKLRAEGVPLIYRETDQPFTEAIQEAYRELRGTELCYITPRERSTRNYLADAFASAGIPTDVLPDPEWYVSPMEFREWLATHPHPKLEDFYRMVRRKHAILMHAGKPVGGTWNFDKENRKPFPRNHQPTAPFTVSPESAKQSVMEKVRSLTNIHGSVDGFSLPVSREDAENALTYFIENLLPLFGPYEDAMSSRDAYGYHSLLSPLINLGILTPSECVETAIFAYENGTAPLPSVEGFVRQILGWREFMFHMFETFAGDYQTTNHLNHTRPLPDWYWTGETRMNCLRTVIRRVRETGYSHHIERLMVLGNFALLYGTDPNEINEWFWQMYIDAYEWVVVSNVKGMSQFADGGWIATKPYISSGAYIDRMSDYCRTCPYNPKEAVGESACPFTTLYWSFLIEHESEPLSGRMTQNYFGLQRKDLTERAQILEHKQRILPMIHQL
jgi:deoxyribodipyrimidine photolyase-related protein